MARLLNDLFGIQARGGCACAGPYGHALLGVGEELSLRLRAAVVRGFHGVKPGWTRVSLAYYMSREEVRFVLAAVDFVAAHGHRFLPLYAFDWATGDWAFRRRTFQHHAMREELLRERHQEKKKSAAAAGGAGDDEHGGLGDGRYERYLEIATRIALSLPDTYDELVSSVPKGIDPDIILFRV